MTCPDRFGEILRRALPAEAALVVPAGDGLERIRARIAAVRPPWWRRAIDRMRKAGVRGAIPGTGPYDTHPHKH